MRNGWYTQNYTMNLAGAQHTGALPAAVGDAAVAVASRRDYAGAIAVVLPPLATTARPTSQPETALPAHPMRGTRTGHASRAPGATTRNTITVLKSMPSTWYP